MCNAAGRALLRLRACHHTLGPRPFAMSYPRYRTSGRGVSAFHAAAAATVIAQPQPNSNSAPERDCPPPRGPAPTSCATGTDRARRTERETGDLSETLTKRNGGLRHLAHAWPSTGASGR